MPIESDIKHLRLVAAIAETGSVTRAAEQLHLTQSALSHQLNVLESRLNTPLFHRVGKRMLPTAAGAHLIESAHRVLDIVTRAEAGVRRTAAGEEGRVRLSTECYTCYHWLPPVMKQFAALHPRVDVRIDVSATHEPLKAVLDGRIDVGVMNSPVRPDRRLATRPLFEDEMLVVMAASHRLADRPFVPPDEFAKETLLLYPPREESTIYQRVLAPAGIEPVSVQQVPLTEAIIELVRAGLGVAVLASWAIMPYVRGGGLRTAPLTRAGYRRQWSAVMLKDTASLTYIQTFLDLVAASAPSDGRAAATPSARRSAARRPREAPGRPRRPGPRR